MGNLAGSEKMDIALDYAVKRLRTLGITVSADEIRAKIQEAWVKLDKIPKQQAGSVVSTDIVEEVVKSEIDKVVQR